MIHGDARLHADNVVRDDLQRRIDAESGKKSGILATGSSPVIPDIPELICRRLDTSRDILRMDDWNFDCLTVIGGGVTGVGDRDDLRGTRFPRDAFEQANRLLESMDPDDFRADGSESAF